MLTQFSSQSESRFFLKARSSKAPSSVPDRQKSKRVLSQGSGASGLLDIFVTRTRTDSKLLRLKQSETSVPFYRASMRFTRDLAREPSSI